MPKLYNCCNYGYKSIIPSSTVVASLLRFLPLSQFTNQMRKKFSYILLNTIELG